MTSATPNHFDIFIIGGGINGCGIARDAVGRGYSVCLCDSSDLGSGTSSASTKLIHGGLRYLEYYEFRLVREALMEREIIWKMAPHIVEPLRFVLPHHTGLRPKWLLRLGLFFYDYMGGRSLLPASTTLNLRKDQTGACLKPEFKTAFEYSDCRVDDARLVILNAMDAASRGADIRPHTKVLKAQAHGEKWRITLENSLTGDNQEITADLVVNAAGPWVDEVLRNVFGMNDVHNVRLVRGSHIVIKKKFQHDKCYIFQNADDRIVFAIPYKNDYTLIGTTDAEHDLLDGRPQISPEETDYLCEMASNYFVEAVTPQDIVWTYSGVRSLYDDGASAAQEATRDYVLVKEDIKGAPLINIFGGKITTFRKLAESMLEEIEDCLGERNSPWTKDTHLPGGDFPIDGVQNEIEKLKSQFSFIEDDHATRLILSYGTYAKDILQDATQISDLGLYFGADLYQKEVEYLQANEWVFSAEDILYRRTKLGIAFTKKQTEKLSDFINKS